MAQNSWKPDKQVRPVNLEVMQDLVQILGINAVQVLEDSAAKDVLKLAFFCIPVENLFLPSQEPRLFSNPELSQQSFTTKFNNIAK